jgi:hypothetical protein
MISVSPTFSVPSAEAPHEAAVGRELLGRGSGGSDGGTSMAAVENSERAVAAATVPRPVTSAAHEYAEAGRRSRTKPDGSVVSSGE